MSTCGLNLKNIRCCLAISAILARTQGVLGAAAGATPVSTGSDGASEVTTVALHRGSDQRLYVDANLDGVACSLALDTGSLISLLDEGTLKKMAAVSIALGEKTVGIGGILPLRTVSVRSSNFGAIHLTKLEWKVADLTAMRADARQKGLPVADGILGIDLLSRLNAVIDFRSDKLLLARRENVPGSRGLARGASPIALPAVSTKSGALFVEAQIENQRLILLVDTGADFTGIDRRICRNLLKARVGASDAGVGGTEKGAFCRAAKLSIGDLDLTDLDVISIDWSEPQKAINHTDPLNNGAQSSGFLGTNVLSRIGARIDFGHSSIEAEIAGSETN